MEEAVAEGAYYCDNYKVIHRVFSLSTLEKSIKEWLGWSYFVMKGAQIVPGYIPLVEVGYSYNSWKFLVFIATKESVSAACAERGNIYRL